MTPDDDFTDLGESPLSPPPLTGWQVTFRVAKGLLFAAVILGVLVAVVIWVFPERKHDWKFLVQRDAEGIWKVVGEYTDESACLHEARMRNDLKETAMRFACYSKDESADEEESVEILIRREGYH